MNIPTPTLTVALVVQRPAVAARVLSPPDRRRGHLGELCLDTSHPLLQPRPRLPQLFFVRSLDLSLAGRAA